MSYRGCIILAAAKQHISAEKIDRAHNIKSGVWVDGVEALKSRAALTPKIKVGIKNGMAKTVINNPARRNLVVRAAQSVPVKTRAGEPIKRLTIQPKII